jgi:diacylglycerol diphosphate phosphatase / phosphatidate phosphatase
MFVILIPSLGAALVAGSRIMDARHHPFDVISGSLIGIVIAWIAYRQYFPPISDFRAKGRAHPMRTWGKEAVARGAADNDYAYQQPIPQEEDAPRSSGNYLTANRHLMHRGQSSSATARKAVPPFSSSEMSDPPKPTITPVRTSEAARGADNAAWEDTASENGSEGYEVQPHYTC